MERFTNAYTTYLLFSYLFCALSTVPALYYLWRYRKKDRYFYLVMAWLFNCSAFLWFMTIARWFFDLGGPHVWASTWLFAVLMHGNLTVAAKAYLSKDSRNVR